MEDTSTTRQQKHHTNNRQHSPKKSLETMIGKTIKIKTASNEQIEGFIYTYDRITNCLVIDCTTHTKQSNFRIIKISYIKEIISISGEAKKDYMPIQPIPVDRLKHRESETVKEFKHQVSKIGVGVTKEAQDIFNALSKTLPCRWSKDTIVVMDEILISPPYGVEDCKANATSAALLARVKKVLEGERKRLLK
ncbi:anticodon-binding domain-containing protein [Gilbertella persicaria]|uniref:anticodon-binding domain-containing protein n=1 Tax=Gilbertella persicaria TaxID=101096 RepID=UPI00221F99FC|nr:anticodon-binding domain-containing protein [Gilbertella persicaria]KAI8063403.1 anticodon-binding domain-containing protein [Gilbertella persicaria]